METEWIPLEAMSARQCRVVECNLPLVYLTLQRHRYLSDRQRTGREPKELFQEGSLALIEAVRTHDANRHGEFAAFAMARIHFAISRYVHEYASAIRVPFITQRRRRKNQSEEMNDRRKPDPLPRVVSMKHARKSVAYQATSESDSNPPSTKFERTTIGDLIRERYDRAVREVASELKNSPRCSQDRRHLIERCVEERWNVPEPTARTSIRKLAKSLSCSVGRITHCEERFRKRLATVLIGDETYQKLKQLAKEKPEGWRHCPSLQELG